MQKYQVRGDAEVEGDVAVDITGGKLRFQGKARRADLMGYSLFPGFMDCIRDNVYLIPSMLLTVIGGAISLTVGARKNWK